MGRKRTREMSQLAALASGELTSKLKSQKERNQSRLRISLVTFISVSGRKLKLTLNMAPRPGNRNFSTSESMNMLGIMSNILPISGDDWLAVLAMHTVNFPGREVESLRRKFSTLHRKKVPTGDPGCPTDVKLAKRIEHEISSRADIGDGAEEMDLASGSFANALLPGDGMFDEGACDEDGE
jgi:hypothetical protein